MTAQILKSKITSEAEFRALLDEYIQAKIASLDAVGEAAPHDHFLEQFIKRTPQGDPLPDKFEMDYELVDDTPPPEELLKRAVGELRAQETAEIETIIPSHKRRLLEMDNQLAQRAVSLAAVKGETASDAAKIIDDFQALQSQIWDIQYAYAKREAEL